jgi:hypothetical protein
VSPNGSDANGCTSAAPCASFARAATVASSGATIEVSGSLGDQFFAGGYQGTQGDINKTLTFHGQPGNKVRALHFGSGNFTFDGINVDAGGTKTAGATFENGGTPFTFKNGSIGNVRDEKGAMIDGSGMVFDNVRFHDVVIATSGVHAECIFASVPERMVVRNSTFTNCAVMDIFFVWPDWWSPLPPAYGNVVLEGNVFGDPDGSCCGLYIGGTGGPASNKDTSMRGWTIKNNRFDDGQSVGAAVNSTICGNTGKVAASWTTPC